MEGDMTGAFPPFFWMEFQSTPSAWRETDFGNRSIMFFAFQSTPSAWRETCYDKSGGIISAISIHSLRMEGDAMLRLL